LILSPGTFWFMWECVTILWSTLFKGHNSSHASVH
jgi:hypothetical protein